MFEEAERIAIWGFGREGQAALQFVSERAPDAVVTILNDTALESDAAAGLDVITGEAASQAISDGRFDMVIRSPGISLYRPEIAAGTANGTRFTTGTNLWFEAYPDARKIAITGTKGKSTTSSVLYHVCQKAGLDVVLVGNVGIPALLQKPGRDLTVMELSSYQIADLMHAPDFAVITNLYPEHTPWHGGLENYFRDKLRLLELSERTVRLCNYANERLRARVGQRFSDLAWFNHDGSYHVRDGVLYFRDERVSLPGNPLRGTHNLQNLAAVLAAADAVGAHQPGQPLDLSGYRQLPHRLEEFRLANGRLCVDDSIATVPEAAVEALNAFAGQSVVLFLGGTERGQNFALLYEAMARATIEMVVCLPANGERIAAELAASGLSDRIRVETVGDLAEGIRLANLCASAEAVFLLSPAAPSFGQFRNFEERGEAFKRLCRS